MGGGAGGGGGHGQRKLSFPFKLKPWKNPKPQTSITKWRSIVLDGSVCCPSDAFGFCPHLVEQSRRHVIPEERGSPTHSTMPITFHRRVKRPEQQSLWEQLKWRGGTGRPLTSPGNEQPITPCDISHLLLELVTPFTVPEGRGGGGGGAPSI